MAQPRMMGECGLRRIQIFWCGFWMGCAHTFGWLAGWNHPMQCRLSMVWVQNKTKRSTLFSVVAGIEQLAFHALQPRKLASSSSPITMTLHCNLDVALSSFLPFNTYIFAHSASILVWWVYTRTCTSTAVREWCTSKSAIWTGP